MRVVRITSDRRTLMVFTTNSSEPVRITETNRHYQAWQGNKLVGEYRE